MTRLPPAQRPDPSAANVSCAICGTVITVGESYSFVVIFATTGHPAIPAFQCPAEQHFTCSVAHAQAAAHACIDEHLVPMHEGKTGHDQQFSES